MWTNTEKFDYMDTKVCRNELLIIVLLTNEASFIDNEWGTYTISHLDFSHDITRVLKLSDAIIVLW